MLFDFTYFCCPIDFFCLRGHFYRLSSISMAIVGYLCPSITQHCPFTRVGVRTICHIVFTASIFNPFHQIFQNITFTISYPYPLAQARVRTICHIVFTASIFNPPPFQSKIEKSPSNLLKPHPSQSPHLSHFCPFPLNPLSTAVLLARSLLLFYTIPYYGPYLLCLFATLKLSFHFSCSFLC